MSLENWLLLLTSLAAVVWPAVAVGAYASYRRCRSVVPERHIDVDPRMRPRVSVVIPARDEEHDIEATVRSVLAQEGVELEVIVINDYSTDRTGEVINRLGFQYINGCLRDGGFFDGSSGLWLTGNFVSTPLRLVNSVNDGMVGQAGSAMQLAALMTRIANGTLVDATASSDMQMLLRGQVEHSTPWMLRGSTPVGFTAVYNKVGVADLKPANGGGSIFAEAGVVRHTSSGRPFAVAWTNARLTSDGWDPIGRLVDKTIDDYINSP